jgi:dihydroxyacetone kinase
MRRTLGNLRERGLSVARIWMGNYMTALEMPGFSISILPVDEARLALLDLPTDAPAWTPGLHPPSRRTVIGTTREVVDAVAAEMTPHADRMRAVVAAVAEALLRAESELTDLDAQAGDGDLGASLARGAQAVLELPERSYASPEVLLRAMSEAMRRAIGGSSGPFYAVALLRAAQTLRGIGRPSDADWRNAFASGIAAIGELGGARRNDRTMLDAMIPALEAWTADSLAAAVNGADVGARATSQMQPRQGRASYLGERAMGVPDAGAVAVSIWMRALAAATV